ncbi:CDP-diacylglycerol diphosphatase [Frateuria aurantia]
MAKHSCKGLDGSWRRWGTWLAGLALTLPLASTVSAENPSQLWNLVQRCEAQAKAGHLPPRPCAQVIGAAGSAGGYAVLKDRDGRAQYLLLPLRRTPGIEADSLITPDAPPFLADAWGLQPRVSRGAGAPLPRQAFGLVVNSAYGRSQNQLHIHADCMAPWLIRRLADPALSRSTAWQSIDLPLDGKIRHFQLRWLPGEALTVNPFRELAAHLAPGDAMAEHSLVLVGGYDAAHRPGFFLLSGRHDAATGDPANADRMQDRACHIVHALSAE